MSELKDKIYKILPNFFQNLFVVMYDWQQYKIRHSGNYRKHYNYYEKSQTLSFTELKSIRDQALVDFISFSLAHSPYYRDLIKDVEINADTLGSVYRNIPIQSKEDIRQNIESIYTISKNEAVLSKTGGTTGKSLEVRFTYDDMQNRFALLDFFRSKFGYKLGEKVAWFSGKSLLSNSDLEKHRYYKYDWLYKKRYYSTFHINASTAKYYIDDLNKFRPLFSVGFPSSMYEIARWGLTFNYPLNYKMKAIFPTAETIIESEKRVIESFFGGKVVNQYASSEGAPFILECEKGRLHLELLTGHFEVFNELGEPAQEGELVFTSFSTHGTPLIRYAIKDRIRLSDHKCDCGNNNPVVDKIEGRINDYIYSEERGKINLGNISNCVKYVKGVIKFQIEQKEKDAIKVLIMKDESYGAEDEKKFLFELRERLGSKITIAFDYVPEIPRESSGKYRIVKQSLVI